MSLRNPLGDAIVSDPQAMRALAHPVRLAALSYLQRNGPATATGLAPHVGATPSVTSWHLRHLAAFGLVVDADPADVPGDKRQRWWAAPAHGFRLEIGASAEADAAGRAIGGVLMDTAGQQIDAWRRDSEPALEPDWRRLAGVSNTTVRLTAGELSTLADAVDELLGPYVLRPDDQVPPDARLVRVLRHFLPGSAGDA